MTGKSAKSSGLGPFILGQTEVLLDTHVSAVALTQTAMRWGSVDQGPALLLDVLQAEQHRHDAGYHQDILALPLQRRMTHFALHMTKYTGHFIEALEAHDVARFERTLTDAFIIVLASANALDFHIARALMTGPNHLRTWPLGHTVFSHEFAKIAARLAKACEAHDHGEDYPVLQMQHECILALTHVLLAETALRHFDLGASVRRRWREVERKIMATRQVRSLG